MKICIPGTIIICTAIFAVGFFYFFIGFIASADQSGTVVITVKISVCGNNIKEASEQCDGADFGGTSCINLGYSGGTLGCSAACEHQVSSCISATPQTSTTPTIDSSSGESITLTNSDNTTVVFAFPANVYTEDIKLQANSYANNFFVLDKPAPSGKSFIGKTYDFNLTTASTESQVPTTAATVTITINYSDSDISGIDENTLAPYRWGASDTSWQLISGATIDATNNKVTFSTTHFSAFALFGSLSQPSGGGGGGGAYIPPTITKVIIQGKAYPLSSITVLQDGKVAVSTTADSQANFKVEITNITAGIWTFGIWAEGKEGRRSITFSFTTSVTSGMTTTISGIFLPPTIELSKTALQRGETLNILGITAPQSEVSIFVNSPEEIIKKTKAEKDGTWFYGFDTTPLDEGSHSTRAKATSPEELLSTFSQTLAFSVGRELVAVIKKADINKDGKTNLVDFSILLYNWGVPKNVAVDLNSDGKVNLVDFSIMLYWWTG